MNATDNELDMACELMKGLCILIGILIFGTCTVLVLLIGQPMVDQLLSVAQPIFHFIGG